MIEDDDDHDHFDRAFYCDHDKAEMFVLQDSTSFEERNRAA